MHNFLSRRAVVNPKAFYDEQLMDIVLTDKYRKVLTLTQMQQLVRQATVEHNLAPQKSFSYHLLEVLYQFNRRECLNFLMAGVGDTFFDLPRDSVLMLVGRYFLGDYTKEQKH